MEDVNMTATEQRTVQTSPTKSHDLGTNENEDENTEKGESALVDKKPPAVKVREGDGRDTGEIQDDLYKPPSLSSIEYYHDCGKSKRILMCISLGLRNQNGDFFPGSDYRKSPYKNIKKGIFEFKPRRSELMTEMERRFRIYGKSSTPPYSTMHQMDEWLKANPILDPEDIAFFKQEVVSFSTEISERLQISREWMTIRSRPRYSEKLPPSSIGKIQSLSAAAIATTRRTLHWNRKPAPKPAPAQTPAQHFDPKLEALQCMIDHDFRFLQSSINGLPSCPATNGELEAEKIKLYMLLESIQNRHMELENPSRETSSLVPK